MRSRENQWVSRSRRVYTFWTLCVRGKAFAVGCVWQLIIDALAQASAMGLANAELDVYGMLDNWHACETASSWADAANPKPQRQQEYVQAQP